MKGDSLTNEAYALLKRHVLTIIDQIQGEDVDQEIKEVEKEMLYLTLPKIYSGAKGEEVKHIKNFNDMVIILNQHKVGNPRNMTTLQFFQAVVLVKDQVKPLTKRKK